MVNLLFSYYLGIHVILSSYPFTMKKYTYTLAFLVLLMMYGSEVLGQKGIHWMSWEEAMEKSKTEKRFIFIDVYTQWCGWCKRMDKNTFQQEEVAKYINEHYYPIRFDAEYKDVISLHGKEYHFVPSGRRGYHELAAAITFGKLSFPTIVFMDPDWKVIQPIPGYQDAKTFRLISKYFAEGYYKNTPWDVFQRNSEK